MRAKLFLIVILVGILSGCISTGHHTTANEMKFPAGSIYEREYDRDGGAMHHVLVIHAYPNGTNVSTLEADFVEILDARGWQMLATGNITDHARYLDAQKREEYLSCQVGRASNVADEARGVPFECRFGGQTLSYQEAP